MQRYVYGVVLIDLPLRRKAAGTRPGSAGSHWETTSHSAAGARRQRVGYPNCMEGPVSGLPELCEMPPPVEF